MMSRLTTSGDDFDLSKMDENERNSSELRCPGVSKTT
jgi:hypothetical protein